MAIDILFLVAAGYGFFVGYSRGIVQTVFTALAYMFGLMVAFKFAPVVTDVLVSLTGSDSALMIVVGFAVAFFLTIIVVRMISNGIEELLQVAHVNIINQFVGGVFMATIIVLIYSVLVWFADEAALIEPSTKTQAISYPFLKEYPGRAKKVSVAFMPIFENFMDQSKDILDKLKKRTGGVEKSESNIHIYDIDENASPNLPKSEQKEPPPKPKKKEYNYDEY